VTEAEWLGGWSYRAMYDLVRDRATTRQVRLYMAASCRLKTADFFDPRVERALETAERCADDPQVEAAANAIWMELVTASPRHRLPQTGPGASLARAIRDAWHLLDEWWEGVQYRNARHALTHAVFMCLRDSPREVFTGGEGDAVDLCALAIDSADALQSGVPPEDLEADDGSAESGVRRAIANLLRDIFGNPFRPAPALDPAWLAWNGGTVRKLAGAAYEERSLPDGILDNARVGVLADALEDAGCADAELLGHLRAPGPHVRGCRAVDLLLGKE
jgi:hypothetical protein